MPDCRLNLKPAILFFAASLCFAAISLGIFKYNEETGRIVYTFANGGDDFSKVSSVTVSLPGQQEFVFERENNLWLAGTADSYPASYKLMKELFDFIRSSAVFRKVDISDAEAEKLFAAPVKISLYDKSGKELDSVAFGQKIPGHQMSYAQIKNQDGYYLVENNIRFPREPYVWLQQPLLSLIKSTVRSVEIDGKTASRPHNGAPFLTPESNREVHLETLFELLKFVGFTKVLSAQNFDEKAFPEHKRIIITEFSGLIVTLDIFKRENEYWIKQKLSAAPLTQSRVGDYIKDSSFLYDFWYFRIAPELGKGLFESRI